MGGAWKIEDGEPLPADMKALVEIVIEGEMTAAQVLAFREALNNLLQNHGTFAEPKRKIKLKKTTSLE
jgi:hypothetical protein